MVASLVTMPPQSALSGVFADIRGGDPTSRAVCRRDRDLSTRGQSTGATSGFPFSTYVASSAALPLPTFFTAWIAPAGTVRASPALKVFGGWPSI
jgi:hypothetical protein